MKTVLFIDTEVTAQKKIVNIWAIDQHWKLVYSWNNVDDFYEKAKDFDVLAWHNIIHHDLNYLWNVNKNIIPNSFLEKPTIDTLWLSSLIFIRKPYHKLIKEYKQPIDPNREDELDSFFMRHQPDSEVDEEIDNDPVKDSEYSLKVFENCVEEFTRIDDSCQQILYSLLWKTREFGTFFDYLINNKLFSSKKIDLNKEIHSILEWELSEEFFEKELPGLINGDKEWLLSFAYIFRLIEQNLNRNKSIDKDCSILPRWIIHTLWGVNSVFSKIYKYKIFDAKKELSNWNGITNYREYKFSYKENWKLINEVIKQEDIVNAWFCWEDFIAILATWWWKSLCFQVPALARAEHSWFLTLVISPLQSLMEDQVENLNKRFYKTNVWALHSALDPLTKKDICEKIENWWIDLLYLSPEMLRSPSTRKLLRWRHIDRLVIDEAHCFSKWWHDFRIDYMFIADFIHELWKENSSIQDLSISCFTATAKQEVVDEIKKYFKLHFNKDLKEYKSRAKRENLHYEAYEIPISDKKSVEDKNKFEKLIEIIENRVWKQACIIFTRLTGQKQEVWARNLAQSINDRLKEDWKWEIVAWYFHGQMWWKEKIDMMSKFMNNETNIIVATNAFWMGVDKKDVRFVIHYDMPSSLENYLQEAWRAWRDWEDATCIVLHSLSDLDNNLQLNQTSQLKKQELQKLLKFIKNQFQNWWKTKINKSAKEFIKYSWWLWWNFDEVYESNKKNLETKVKTALWFLQKPFPDSEDTYFIKRHFNKTRVFATAKWKKIIKNSIENIWDEDLNSVYERINSIPTFDDEEREKAKEIYRYIRTWKVISIEDLEPKIWWHMRRKWRKEDSDWNPSQERKLWIEEIVDTLRDYGLIDKDDSITLALNVSWNESSKKRAEDISYFISTIFDLFTELYWWYISESLKIRFSIKDLNAEVTKRIWNTNNMDKIQHLLYIMKIRGYVNIVWDEMLSYIPFPEIRQKIISELDKWSILIDMILDHNVSKNQKEKSWITIEDKLKSIASDLWNRTNEAISVIQLESILKLLHEFDIIWVESWLFLYRTRFEISPGDHLVTENEDWSLKYNNLNAEHYKALEDFYINKTQQAHIMDEFVIKIIEKLPWWKKKVLVNELNDDWEEINYEKEVSYADMFANEMTDDYFNLDYINEFLPKYFKSRLWEISRSTSKAKHNQIWFENVSDEQRKILESKKNLLVVAWPWSWKTNSIVHKVAELVLEWWVSKNEFLLLTFMRSAKFELKDRIVRLMWKQWYWLNIQTFHWFAYELLEKNPLKWEYNSNDYSRWRKNRKLSNDKIINEAIDYLETHDDLQLSYRVIMVDEFQDIWETYFKFIEAISKRSSYDENKIVIIATWDDDQSIMEFQWADVKYIQSFKERHNADSIILSENFRSTQEIVDVTNWFISSVSNRLKEWTKLVSWRVEDIFNVSKIEAWNFSWNYLYWTIDALEEIKSKKTFDRTAIICSENETVLQISHLLKKKWYKPQVLMSNDWYKLRDALELRYFLDLCESDDWNWWWVNNENVWDKYKAVINKFWENKNINVLKKIIDTLLATNSQINPRIVKDFMIDISDESDLIWDDSQLYVSTIHKAKWREFDNVIFCFDPNKTSWRNNDYYSKKERDKIKKLIYVWLTRAKNNIIILWNKEDNNYFKEIYEDNDKIFHNIIKKEKTYSWEEVNEISVVTWLWDTYMSYNKKDRNYWPRIWEEVSIKLWKSKDGFDIWEYYYNGLMYPIQKSSSSLLPYLEQWFSKWYKVESVKVNQKIKYCPKDDTNDHLIFLFDILLKKIPKEFAEINEANDKIKKLEERIKQLSIDNDGDEYKSIIAERDKQIKLLEEKAKVLEWKLNVAQELINEREKNIRENNKKIEWLLKDIDSIIADKEDKEYKISKLESQLENAFGDKELYDWLKIELEKAKKDLEHTISKLELTSKEKDSLEERNQQLVDENANLRKENEELSRKIEEAKQWNDEWNKWHIFKAWEGDKLKDYLIKQIKSASKSVIIIDPYIDDYTFELIWFRRIWVKGEIRYEMKKTLYMFKNDRNRLTEVLNRRYDQEGNAINVRHIGNLHDRFLIIDDVVWWVGTSMNNSMGGKVTTVQKLKNSRLEILDAYR